MSETEEDNRLVKIIKFIKSKVPVTVLTINSLIIKYCYQDCSTNIGVFWGYYITLNIICLIWEGFYNYVLYRKYYKQGLTINHIQYTVVSTFCSLLLFNTYCYFMRTPFDCYFTYDSMIADVIFFLSVALVMMISSIESYCFDKIESPDIGISF